MCMWYNDLFSPVLLCKYQPCICRTLLCPSVVLVWKCVLMCSFACINMIETSGVCCDHILISGGHPCNNKKLNVSYGEKKNK